MRQIDEIFSFSDKNEFDEFDFVFTVKSLCIFVRIIHLVLQSRFMGKSGFFHRPYESTNRVLKSLTVKTFSSVEWLLCSFSSLWNVLQKSRKETQLVIRLGFYRSTLSNQIILSFLHEPKQCAHKHNTHWQVWTEDWLEELIAHSCNYCLHGAKSLKIMNLIVGTLFILWFQKSSAFQEFQCYYGERITEVTCTCDPCDKTVRINFK